MYYRQGACKRWRGKANGGGVFPAENFARSKACGDGVFPTADSKTYAAAVFYRRGFTLICGKFAKGIQAEILSAPEH